jgi:hypothetical protein
MRPWVGSYLSVGQLEVLRDLEVVNCTADDRRRKIYFAQPDATERERVNWMDIDDAFSTPVTVSDDLADYAPTQALAELFRQQGFDGIAYRSGFGPGHDLALFDLDSTRLVNCQLYRVDSIKLKFSAADEGYSVRQRA